MDFSWSLATSRKEKVISSIDVSHTRNIGIISHIDAGKTTVTERILFYSGETHKMGEVHDGQAVMDWMPQEQERGITITASATSCRWGDYRLNLIDTPGHIDFTIEVERSVRVLDGAVAIFSAVEGVQPQSELVWRQADRYRVPRVCLINKMDRMGADYSNVLSQMGQRLGARPVLLQLPVGAEASFSGVIDLLSEEFLTFSEQDQGRTVVRGEVPQDAVEAVREARLELTEVAADFDDRVMAAFLEGKKVETALLKEALRQGTLSCQIFPVLFGSALRNKGVQPVLDAVCLYLPSPIEVASLVARKPGGGDPEPVLCDPGRPLAAFAFKVMAEEGRRLTYLRIYSGTVKAGASLLNATRGNTERVRHLFHMHAHKREEVAEATAGDIVAVTGCQSTLTGDTLCDQAHPLVLEGMTIPEPVVSIAVEAKGIEDRAGLLTSLEYFQWEDPTFRVHEDQETGQTILTGMGELHLEVIIDRLRREYGVQVKTGRPRVVFREALRREVERREVFQALTEKRPERAEILLRLVPLSRGSGIRIVLPEPKPPLTAELLATLEQSLLQGCQGGGRTGYALTDLEVQVLELPVDPGMPAPGENTLRAAAQRGLALAAREAEPYLLEPIMKLELETPAEYLGKVLGGLQQKRGRVEGLDRRGELELVKATVPLAEMFGYMTELRSASKGRGSYTMEFQGFEEAPLQVQEQFGLRGSFHS
ncbi:Translation elongation factor G-related protein [Citrifermentans bremense]|uniref:Elongation factor G n=1 Tax=Citrifermentans bremense TaxID=60035 RepID=A0A6S6LXW0_9BACT|nr:Translation elongation factor G-related protein [Citrifermentans bremense]